MEGCKYQDKFRFIFFIISLFLLGYLGKFFHIDTSTIQGLLSKIPFIYSGLLFILLYVIVTFFIWFSKDVFRLFAAISFGPYLSTILIYLAETINSFILFNLARYLGRGYLEKNLEKRFKNLDERLNKLSFFWLLMFRGVPLLPFRFLDLGVGLTNISFKKYLLAVILASPVRILWLQYILAGVGKSILDNPGALQEFFLAHKNLFVFSLLYFLFVIMVFIKIKHKE